MAKHAKEVRKIVQDLLAQGFTVTMSGGSHYRICPKDPSKPVQFISSTPSDWHAVANMKAQLKKAGIQI